MLIVEKKQFAKGFVMAMVFFAVLGAMFSPLFNGESAFVAADKLFNSIAKGSTNYFERLREETAEHKDKTFEVSLEFEDQTELKNALTVLSKAGLDATAAGNEISIKGKFGRIVELVLKDSEAMFFNKGQELEDRYGMAEKQAQYTWWRVFKELERSLTAQKQFKEAKFIKEVTARGIEVGYNFYGIQPESSTTKAGILSFSLIFYVIYTLWWGFAIFFLAEGVGLKLTGGRKKEA